jgi:mediator of RNA polymerase II transcription subunit 15
MSATANTPQNDPPGSVEDAQYLEKVKELGKYIEPLRSRIARIGSDDTAKLEKMKKLMDILSNPSKRMPMETLKKCEAVLIRLQLEPTTSGMGAVSQPPSNTSAPAATVPTSLSSSSGSQINPLLEAIINLRNASKTQPLQMNHTLQKTFGAPLEAIYGSEITLQPMPKKRRTEAADAEEASAVSDVIQGEVARLQRHFKVSLDQTAQTGGVVSLVCHLDDANLPSVPPISVALPPKYPEDASPTCDMSEMTEYYATPFLVRVEEALTARLAKMPPRYTLSQLLGAWEMAVRAACSPRQVDVSKQALLLGM